MLLKILNSCTPVKNTLLPTTKKLLERVEAIFVHGLIDNVNFWFKLSRMMIDPRLTESNKPECVYNWAVGIQLDADKLAESWSGFIIFVLDLSSRGYKIEDKSDVFRLLWANVFGGLVVLNIYVGSIFIP